MSASSDGELQLKVETDEVTVATHFKNMNLEGEEDSSSQNDQNETIEARVDIQKLVLFLHVQQFNFTKAVCGIVHNHAVHMFLQCHYVTFQYFLPAVNMSMV